jgi:hypothetical protein
LCLGNAQDRAVQKTPDYCLHNIRGKGIRTVNQAQIRNKRSRNRPVNFSQGGESGSNGMTEISAADQIVVVMNPGKPEGVKGLACSVFIMNDNRKE